MSNLKESITNSIQQFNITKKQDCLRNFFNTLGYVTDRELSLDSDKPQDFLEALEWDDFQKDKSLFNQWLSVDFLFQLTEDEINSERDLFKEFDNNYLTSYIFLAISLEDNEYSRTQLSQFTREINRNSQQPVFILFWYGNKLTLSIINRRPNKLDDTKDVLEKITLIKDININSPHRAHLEILHDFASPTIFKAFKPQNFDDLHTAWQKVLDTSELNKKFFKEISNWYFYAVDNVTFPDGIIKDKEVRNATNIIRLITRLIFVWFVKEKKLIDDVLFKKNEVSNLLKSFQDEESNYYKAILQNLFFATLNNPALKEGNTSSNRKFRGKNKGKGQDQHFMSHNLYRYESYFKNPQDFLDLTKNIPFLNGGLFECLDEDKGKGSKPRYIRIDGFSDRNDNVLTVPNRLFFGEETTVDLSKVYGSKKKSKEKVQGIIHIFNRYKFTIDENTPLEEEIALDPELLGKVFENLLAAYNPETGSTARKQTGSFYTPREIVNYMVDESLIAYLENTLISQTSKLSVKQASSLSMSSLSEEQTSSLSNNNNNQDGCFTEEDVFFSENIDIDITQRNLPHWKQFGVTYFVTFRLADSIPQSQLRQLHDEREDWLKLNKHPLTKAQKAEYHRLFSQKVDHWLDAGMGECYLKNLEVAQIVADALQYFNGDRYNLGDYVIMPNHVHVLVTPLENHQLSEILHSWKSFTAKKINKLLKRKGHFWQIESYDRIIRSPEHLYSVQQYIANNPKKANIKLPKVSQASSLSNNNNNQDNQSVSQASSLSNNTNNQDNQSVKQASSLSMSSLSEEQVSSLSNNNNNQDNQSVKQASSLSMSSVSKKQASSLSNNNNNQDGCYTVNEKLRHLFSYNSQAHLFNNTEVDALINAIDNLKILDPACGSGAFPMGILQKLVFILTKLDPDNQKWKQQQKEKAIAPVLNDIKIAQKISYEEAREKAIQQLEERLKEIESDFDNNEMDYPRKLFLIENCIYGVDIQPIAVQIAKLRFFISLIVEQKVNDSLPNWGILPLPNLETKFVAANTLIGIETQLTLRSNEVIKKEAELKSIRQRHFTARTPQTKRKYRQQDQQLRKEISELLKSTGLEVAIADTLARWNPYNQNTSADFFDSEWMFGVNDGFDIVIGNPPYVRQEKIKPFKDIFKKQYSCYTGVVDLYVYFFEKSINLLKQKGILTFISSNKYFRAGYGKKLRQFLTEKTTIKQLIDFGDAPVFTAIAYPSIILTVKQASSLSQTQPNKQKVTQASSLSQTQPNKQDACDTGIKFLTWDKSKPLTDFIAIFNQDSSFINQNQLKADGWQLESPQVLQLLDKLRNSGTPLGEYVNGRFYYGIKTGFNEAFIVDRETRDKLISEHESSAEVLKPLIRGRDVKRWVLNYQDLWLIFTRRGIDIEKYPAVKNHLMKYKDKLENRAGSCKWYEIQANITYYKDIESPKIIYPDIFDKSSFIIDNHGFYLVNTLYFLCTDEKWLCGFLNSSVFDWYYSFICNKVRGGYLRAFTDYMKQIPIPKVSNKQDACVTELVDEILKVKAKDIKADVSELEKAIDKIVYELYDLTEEEIKLIDNG